MSISDDNAGRANQADTQKSGSNNPAAGQGGQPASKGLPGLAAFSQMQAYTAAAQPPVGNAPGGERQPEPESHASGNYAVPNDSVHDSQPDVAAPDTGFSGGNDDDIGYSYDSGVSPNAGTSPDIDFTQLDQLDTTPASDYSDGACTDDTANGSVGHAATLQEQLDSYSQESRLPDDSMPEQPQNFDAGQPQNFDAGQPQNFDAGQPQNFDTGQPQNFDAGQPQNFDAEQPYSDQPAYGGYENGSAGAGQEFDTHNSLQTFEARYDQHPEIPLGSFEEPGDQPFFHESGQADADFGAGIGDDGLTDEELEQPGERKSRKVLMIASGLIGALALGGAIAFAYKTGGGAQLASGEAPPLIQADSRPVKVTPVEPGGKQFPHQNKQIYDRLQGDQRPEVEKLVPRQEEVVATAAPGGRQLDSDVVKPATQQVAVADVKPAPSSLPGGPHKVRTLQIKPDGSVVTPPQQTAAAPATSVVPGASVAVAIPQTPGQPAVQSDPATTASIGQQPVPQLPAQTPPPAAAPPAQAAPVAAQQPVSPAGKPAPLPQQKPAAQRQAAVPATRAPARAAAPGGSIYVVQIASRRSQSLALAAFADMQQKYTSLLGNYQPMIQSADLGAKGVWYRLRVGPMSKKAEAASLCKSLKRAGLRSCLVRSL